MKNYEKAFTLSEVLITLAVVGIVAAITVPILNNSTKNKEYNVARQKAQATIGQALRLATVNGEISTSITNAKDFVSNVLAKKYLKISKQCDTATECGFSENIKRPDGIAVNMPTKWSESANAVVIKEMPTEQAILGTFQDFKELYPSYDDSTFFQTPDGFSVNFFYNPYCVSTPKEKYIYYDLSVSENAYIQLSMDVTCFNAVYDMNGKKGPNTVGKDIGFITTFYNSYDTKSVAVLPYKDEKQVVTLPRMGDDYWKAAFDYCSNLDDDNWILPDIDELSSLYLNTILVRGTKDITSLWLWSRVQINGSSGYFWGSNVRTGAGGRRDYNINTYDRSHTYARCVRKTSIK